MNSNLLKLVLISDPVAVAAPRISVSRGWMLAIWPEGGVRR